MFPSGATCLSADCCYSSVDCHNESIGLQRTSNDQSEKNILGYCLSEAAESWILRARSVTFLKN
jgi:hypothetical protein